MDATGKTTLVIPCYQEASRLPREALLAALLERPWLSLLFVDDGSTDGTGTALAALADACPQRTRILTLSPNRGKAEAVRRGLLEALEDAPLYVGFWDADLATPIEEIDAFAAYLDEHRDVDVLYGSRVLLLGRQIERRALRHYGGRIMATLASLVLGLPVYDTQCGAKLLRVVPELGATLETPFLTRWMFDVELLARWSRPDSVHELPVQSWRDVPGSKLAPADFVRSPFELWRIFRHYSVGGSSEARKRLR